MLLIRLIGNLKFSNSSDAVTPIWEKEPHFYLASAEAALPLPAEATLNIKDIILTQN